MCCRLVDSVSESGEIGRRTRLRIWRSNPWGFKSPLSHQGLQLKNMSQPKSTSDPKVVTHDSENFRENYANSVQVRMSVWDFYLVFGTMKQDSPDEVKIENFQGIYLSPQQAKALISILGHNLAQYEQAFGELALEPQMAPPNGPVH